MTSGNQCFPSSVDNVLALRELISVDIWGFVTRFEKMLWTGLYPKKAAKRALVGGIEAKTSPNLGGAPAETTAELSALGKLPERDVIIIVKKMVRLMVCPTF